MNNHTIHKTHLMLFPKQARFGARGVEHRWMPRLPKVGDMTPGYRFELKGTMTSGDRAAVDYRSEGEVLRQEVVKMGACGYPVLVIAINTYLDDELAITATKHLSPDMLILLRSDHVLVSFGKASSHKAVAVE